MSVCIYLCLSVSIYVCLYLSMSVCICLYLSVSSYLFFICLRIYLPTYLSIFLSFCLSVDLSICLSFYLSICLSLYLSIFLSIYLCDNSIEWAHLHFEHLTSSPPDVLSVPRTAVKSWAFLHGASGTWHPTCWMTKWWIGPQWIWAMLPRLPPMIFSWVNRQGQRLHTSWDSGLDLAQISTFFGSGVYLMTAGVSWGVQN